MRPSRTSGTVIESAQSSPVLTLFISDVDQRPSWIWSGTNPAFWVLYSGGSETGPFTDEVDFAQGEDRSLDESLAGGLWYRLSAATAGNIPQPPYSNAVEVP